MFKKLFAAMAVLFMIGATPALAQKVAYYDHAKVINDSNAWKALQAELKTSSDQVSAQLKPLVDEINTGAPGIKALVEGKSQDQLKALSDADKQKVTAWEQKRMTLQASEQRVNQEFSLIRELAEAKINEQINTSLADVAKAKKVDVLMRQTPLGHYGSKYDATSEMTAAVNRKLSTLSVDGLVAEAQQVAASRAANQ